MLNSHNISNEPHVSNYAEECVAASLMWQCSRCGYSESVQGRMQGGIIHIDESNDFYIVNWRVFNNENFIQEVPAIYHVKHSALVEAIRIFGGRRQRVPRRELGCCGKIRLFAWGQPVDPSIIRYKVNETRIHQVR